MFATIETALAVLAEGKPVLVLDDEGRENEGDAILAAGLATEEWVGWMIRHTSGYLCAPILASRAEELGLPLMVPASQDPRKTAYTISVDAAQGITTGISAHDRTLAAHVLADPKSTAADLIRPGHVLPLKAVPGGVLSRAGHTEAATDLCRLAGLDESALICELVHDDGSMRRTPDVLALGAEYDLPVITIASLINYRQRYDRVERIVETSLPTRHGDFEMIGYRDRLTGEELVALRSPWSSGVPYVRLHSECATGDTLGSLRCDCGSQLEKALSLIAKEGGVLVYLRGQEGRGVGLLNKLRAYCEQDNGADTVDAQVNLGLPVDARDYAPGYAILRDLGIEGVRLITNNPAKIAAAAKFGITVLEEVPSLVDPVETNVKYLTTKRDRLGHHIKFGGDA